jgi:hypothetical protein
MSLFVDKGAARQLTSYEGTDSLLGSEAVSRYSSCTQPPELLNSWSATTFALTFIERYYLGFEYDRVGCLSTRGSRASGEIRMYRYVIWHRQTQSRINGAGISSCHRPDLPMGVKSIHRTIALGLAEDGQSHIGR